MTLFTDENIKKEDGQAIVTATATKEAVEQSYNRILDREVGRANLPGFRKGAAPKPLVEKHLGKATLDKEALYDVAINAYSKLATDHKLQPIGQPKIDIDLESNSFTITVPLMPEVTLPDYQATVKEAIKKDKAPDLKVTDEEVTKSLEELKGMYLASLEKQNSGEDKDAAPKDIEINDEFATKVAKVKDLKELKQKITENLTEQKKGSHREHQRGLLLESVREATTVIAPPILVDEELHRMTAQFEGELKQSGFTLDNYLKTINKKRSDLETEWRDTARKRVENELVMMEIAKKEKLTPDPKAVEQEVNNLSEAYQDVPLQNLQMYVTTTMTNQAVLKHLEKVAGLATETENTTKDTE